MEIGDFIEPGVPTSVLFCVSMLSLSDAVDNAKDPFQKRLALNELHEAIQAARDRIVPMAEGLVFVE